MKHPKMTETKSLPNGVSPIGWNEKPNTNFVGVRLFKLSRTLQGMLKNDSIGIYLC
jgi:hypothetical protein